MMISTRELLVSAVQKVTDNLLRQAKQPKLALFFDSFYRFRILGAGYKDQLAAMSGSLGDVPFVGGISFYRMGAPSFSRIDIGNYIWEHSFAMLGLGGRP